MKKLITLLLVLTGCVCTASADKVTPTFYYAVPAATVDYGNYTVELNMKFGSGEKEWHKVTMTNTTKTYDGCYIYSGTIDLDYGGYYVLQFLVNGAEAKKPYDSSTWCTDFHDDKLYNHKSSSWVDYNTDGLKGSWDSWASKTEFVNGEATVSLTALSDKEFKIEVGGSLYGAQNSGAKMFWDDCTNWTLNGSNNCILQVSATGTYTFSIAEDKKVSVTFPSYTTNEVYFYNNHSWEYTPVVYLLGESYWDGDKGSGSYGKDKGHAMTQVGVTNTWRLSYPSSLGNSNGYIAIVKNRQDNKGNFENTEAVYREDFNTSTPLYVPNTTDPIDKNYTDAGAHWTAYWNTGAWHPFPTYTRSVTSGKFGTICLPFAATVEGATVFKIVSKTVDGGSNLTGINLESVDNLAAGETYIFKATGTTLTATMTGNYAAATDAHGMLGTFTATKAPVGSYVVGASDSKIHKVVSGGTGVNVGQYKGWITLTSIDVASSRSANFLSFEDETTGIAGVEMNDDAEQKVVYNLNGQRVANPTKGLYIVNGKKVIMK